MDVSDACSCRALGKLLDLLSKVFAAPDPLLPGMDAKRIEVFGGHRIVEQDEIGLLAQGIVGSKFQIETVRSDARFTGAERVAGMT